MAFLCNLAQKYTNTWQADGNNDERPVGQVRMIISANDYKRTDNALTCTFDGRNMQDLCRSCGIDDVKVIYDDENQIPTIEAAIQEVGSRCGPDDIFVFYYSGHGTGIPDQDGDEEDGDDEAFCFVDGAGQVNFNSCMTDDRFAIVVTEALNPEVRVLILTDCCHSGTIADLGKPEWDDREALSITGCLDNQTSGDVGNGGIFTHSMLLAIEELNAQGEDEDGYSAGKLYNTTLHFDDEEFHSKQDITLQCTSTTHTADNFAWPFIPRQPYVSPMRKATNASRDIGGGGDLSSAGIPPGLLQFVEGSNLPPMGESVIKKSGCSVM